MESFSQFIESWSSIYPIYVEFVIIILIASAIAISITLLYQKTVSVQSLEDKVRNGKSIAFLSNGAFLNLIMLIVLVSGSVLLSIIPSFFRWFLNLQPISTYFYPIFNFLVLFIIYIRFGVPLLVKRLNNTFYINNSYILLKQIGYFITIPFSCISDVSVDKNNKFIRFKYKRLNLGFITRKSKFTTFFVNNDAFQSALQILMDNHLFIVETQLKVNKKLLASLLKNRDPTFNPLNNFKLISEAPLKVIKVLENIWGLPEELNLDTTFKEKKRIFLSFTLFFLFYFILTIWIPLIKPGDYLSDYFSPNDLSSALIFPTFFSKSIISTSLIKQELNHIFYTITCFIVAYLLSRRIFKLQSSSLKLINRQVHKTHIIYYVLSFLMIIYLFFTIQVIYYFFMYNSPYGFIRPTYGNPSNLLSYFSYEFLSSFIVAPIFEELIFRGLFLRYFKSKDYNIIVILAIEFLIFPFIHIPNIIDNSIPYILENLFIKGLFSVISTLLMLKTKNIIYPILYHASWNIFVYLYLIYITPDNILAFENIITGLIIVISIILILLIGLNFKRLVSNLKSFGLIKKDYILMAQMLVLLVLLSQIFWVFTYNSSNLLLNGLFFNLKVLYALLVLAIPFIVIYLFIKPRSSIYNMEN